MEDLIAKKIASSFLEANGALVEMERCRVEPPDELKAFVSSMTERFCKPHCLPAFVVPLLMQGSRVVVYSGKEFIGEYIIGSCDPHSASLFDVLDIMSGKEGRSIGFEHDSVTLWRGPIGNLHQGDGYKNATVVLKRGSVARVELESTEKEQKTLSSGSKTLVARS